MAKYRGVIHQASPKFIWSAVYSYDVCFWQESARVGAQRFDTHNYSLYMTKLDATALRKDAKQCFHCKSFDHKTRECPFLPANALETPVQKKSPSNPQGTYRPAQPWKLEKGATCSNGTPTIWVQGANRHTYAKPAECTKPWQIAHNLPEPWSPFSDPVWNYKLWMTFSHATPPPHHVLEPGHYDPNLH